MSSHLTSQLTHHVSRFTFDVHEQPMTQSAIRNPQAAILSGLARGRHHQGPRRAVLHHVPGRPGRRCGQGQTPRHRRSNTRVGSALCQRRVSLFHVHQPQQAQHYAGRQDAGRRRDHPAAGGWGRHFHQQPAPAQLDAGAAPRSRKLPGAQSPADPRCHQRLRHTGPAAPDSPATTFWRRA